MLDIEVIEARVNATTPGRWGVAYCANGEYGAELVAHELDPEKELSITVGDDGGGAFCNADDAEFCAHARTDIPALIAEVKRLREALADFAGADL